MSEEIPNIMQVLSDGGINPFAAKLLMESYERHHKKERIRFRIGDTIITLEPAEKPVQG